MPQPYGACMKLMRSQPTCLGLVTCVPSTFSVCMKAIEEMPADKAKADPSDVCQQTFG